MKIAMVGLGKMGANMARRLLRHGHECVVYDVNSKAMALLATEGATPSHSYQDLVSKLQSPAVIWLMVPAGKITDNAVLEISRHLNPNDILINGGNSNFKESVKHSQTLAKLGIKFLDIGTSGGIWGESRGYSLMIGGDKSAFEIVEPVFRSLAPEASSGNSAEASAPLGYLYCGGPGAGHFVKMVHNGIEYGMMQALAEGFDILKNVNFKIDEENLQYNFDLAKIAGVWRNGSVVSSWLLDLVGLSLTKSPELSEFEGVVADSGEGRWTVQTAIEAGVPAYVLTAALFTRFRSQQSNNFGEKLLSAMRNNFGGHQEPARRGRV